MKSSNVWKRLCVAMQCAQFGVYTLRVSRDKATRHHEDGTREPFEVWDWTVDRPNGCVGGGTSKSETAAKSSAKRALKRHCQRRIKEAQDALRALESAS